jgi:cytosine deaminase
VSLDLVLQSVCTTTTGDRIVDVGIAAGKIAAIEPQLTCDCEVVPGEGHLVMPGFVETHIHLDKSCVIDRCVIAEGTLQEAIRETARVKGAFTEADIAARATRTLEKAIVAGTTHMRTHVEVDPRIGLKGFHAVRDVARRYAWAIDVEICVFPQEGMLNDPGTEELLIEACTLGADVIGGCPYADTHPHEQIARIFEIARRFDLDIDFHLDFDLDTSWMHVGEVCRHAREQGWQGRVAVGHATKLSALPRDRFDDTARDLARSGVAVTVLPATDLFLMGRNFDSNVPRGVTRADRLMQHGVSCSLATNNVLNAFTPFGDCSLCRIANLYANVAQLGRPSDLTSCLDMITTSAARLMNVSDYGVSVGADADLLLVPCTSPASAVAEIIQPVMGFKRGRRTFVRPTPTLCPPVVG